MSDFFALYKRPEWQRKRLEVMEAAGFKCEQCGAADKTLNVHHKRYVKGRKPWEYENDELDCLCEGCHESFHRGKQLLLSMLGPRECSIDYLLGVAVVETHYRNYQPVPVMNAEQARGVAAGLGWPIDGGGECVAKLAALSGDNVIDWFTLSFCDSATNCQKPQWIEYVEKWRLASRGGFGTAEVQKLFTGESMWALWAGHTIEHPGSTPEHPRGPIDLNWLESGEEADLQEEDDEEFDDGEVAA